MKETILLAPGASGSELIRTMARYGYNTIGYRVMSSAELASYALQLSGIHLKEEILPKSNEAAYIYSFIRQTAYFAAASFTDAEHIATALTSVRSLITADEDSTMERSLSGGEFQDKNNAIKEVYSRYVSALEASNRIDGIGLIRRVISKAKPIDADFVILKEYPLSPLESCLLEKLSGGEYTELSLWELLGKTQQEIHIDSYTKAYGESNEVEHILGAILRNNIPTDTCTVAVGNPSQYAQLFYEYSLRLKLPMTFGCGVPIKNANPAQLLSLLYHFFTDGYCGVDALKSVIFSEAFNRKQLFALCNSEKAIYRKEQLEIISMMGNLRLSDDREENKKKIAAYRKILPDESGKLVHLGYAEVFARELEKGYSYFIRTYSVIRKNLAGRIDRSAVKVICDALDAFEKLSDLSVNEIIPDLLNKTVCSENSREGCLFVTGIEGAMASQRDNLFVAGLSANLFPGSPSENYLILDNDYNHFPNSEAAPTSIARVAMKKKKLLDLLENAAALHIHTGLSYSYYSLAELKMQNPSSVLFEVYKRENGEATTARAFEDGFTDVGFFAEALSNHTFIGRAVLDGNAVSFAAPEPLTASVVSLPDRAYSATAIETFFSCPYKFFLDKLLAVTEQETDNPFAVISPKDYGKLAHKLMELLANNPIDRSSFIQEAERVFDEYLIARPPIIQDSAKNERAAFVRMMENAFDADHGKCVLSAEEDRTVTHNSGVKLHGIPDRVEKTAENEYIIADYKTGWKIKHKKDDIDSCLQAVLYACILEQQGVAITKCEYRYLRDNIVIPCNYNDDIKGKLDDKLETFKTALDAWNFANKERCEDKCCPFNTLCIRKGKKKESKNYVRY